MAKAIELVFTPKPDDSNLFFADAQTPAGKWISVGTWHDDIDGNRVLRITTEDVELNGEEPK